MTKKKYLIYLNSIFITSLLIANIVSVKVCNVFGLTVPAAVFCYCITFLCTDIIGELWGKEEANNTVKVGFICQIIAALLIISAIALPYESYAIDRTVFEAVLGQNVRFVFASMAGYLLAQSWDVFAFHKIKTKTGEKHKWLRNNLSTMSSQLIDTAIFITIAFWGNVPDLGAMIVSQYILKFVLALLDTPFFYYFTHKIKDAEAWHG